MGNRWETENQVKARMLDAGAGSVYPACTRLRLAFNGAPAYRQAKAAEVWKIAIAQLAAGADPEALLYALADGVTLGPHGVPWR